jgi:hypothetical protein
LSAPVPFSNCWWVTDQLVAGPVFFAGSFTTTQDNMDALEEAGVHMIVSLVGLDQFYPDPDEAEVIAWEIYPRFFWYGFSLPDGAAPNKETMGVILQWINVGLLEGGKVFVHCASGCGRTGTIVGCWLADRGIAKGEAALVRIAELRQAAGLSLPCPETEAQRELVRKWRNR